MKKATCKLLILEFELLLADGEKLVVASMEDIGPNVPGQESNVSLPLPLLMAMIS